MFADFLDRQNRKKFYSSKILGLTGLDISPEMSKYKGENTNIKAITICLFL